MVLEKTLESPLDSKEIKPVNPKGNQTWIFIGKTDTDTEAEAPTLWPAAVKTWLTGKKLMLGKMEGRRRMGQQRKRRLGGITYSMDMSVSKHQETVKDREAWHAAGHGVAELNMNNNNYQISHYLSATWGLHCFYYDGLEKFSALKIRPLAFYGCTLVFETQMSPILPTITALTY